MNFEWELKMSGVASHTELRELEDTGTLLLTVASFSAADAHHS